MFFFKNAQHHRLIISFVPDQVKVVLLAAMGALQVDLALELVAKGGKPVD